jgi:phosphoenolpyruvate carboxykinase (ATP)
VNTGWTGGAYGTGERMSLKYTRAMVNAALDGRLSKVEFVTEPAFGLSIPLSCPGVPAELLNPRNAWKDAKAYDIQAAMLAQKFENNFARFEAPAGVREAGPATRKPKS